MPAYAHTLQHRLPAEWEPLFTPFGEGGSECHGESCQNCAEMHPHHGHLNKVAYWTAKFAAEMFLTGSEKSKSAHQWGYLTGLWHDLGKFAPEWQAYLASKADPHTAEISGKVDHSTAGAQFSHENLPLFGTLLSYLIAGHHSGLPDGIDASEGNLGKRLAKRIAPYTEYTPSEILNHAKNLPAIPFALRSPLSLGFLLRMLFSTLVDADFLATEAFMSPERKCERPHRQPTIALIDDALTTHLEKLSATAPTTSVNQIRSKILTHCLTAAEKPPGLFSLTVPTGGGKTLSSLAFALKHARIHNLRRVIYVIPFTSIIEQNAAVFRKALASLGPDIVLEHHSNLDPDSAHETSTNRLATENWDARIIVTTNVQFFESLHANRTSRCRKLHRIARSVIILDEAQALPVEFLAPCLRTLEELHTHYGTSIVLCTATQPAINKDEDFKIGLDSPTEIIPDPTSLYTALKRVSTQRLNGKTDNLTLAALLTQHPQSLTIVNTRRHARELFDILPNDGTRFHLSALMCPVHRSAILYLIKRRLRNKLPIRLISTQLIEAGVDIDFPVVFRSIAGLDSIAQAAGRCDREGKLTAATGKPGGQLFLFETSDYTIPPFIQSATNSSVQVLATSPADPLSLDSIHNYFQRHYWDKRHATDPKHILENIPKHIRSKDDLLNFQFKTTARDFRLIDDYSEPVLIPFGKKGRHLCTQLRETFDPAEVRRLARKLQRYTVNIPKPQHAELLRTGTLLPLHEDRFHLLNSDVHYSRQYGLHPESDLPLPTLVPIL
jgi:CRISPR-associated endonuclease/helicase Cas3